MHSSTKMIPYSFISLYKVVLHMLPLSINKSEERQTGNITCMFKVRPLEPEKYDDLTEPLKIGNRYRPRTPIIHVLPKRWRTL